MILIAPDKYRGTLSAVEAANIAASTLPGDHFVLPMADGGEGTAECLASMSDGWTKIEKGCMVNTSSREAVVESSAFIGYSNFDVSIPPVARSSAPLARWVNQLYSQYRPTKIYVGVGGTAVCDGGRGFLETLNPKVDWPKILVGLVDVDVPLLPRSANCMSALSFCRQKGFDDTDINSVAHELMMFVERCDRSPGKFSGAGGGLGYALSDVIGASCHLGAEYLLQRAAIPWHRISLAITGEGRFDNQSLHGKVVGTVASEAARHGCPTTVCLAGSVSSPLLSLPPSLTVIDCSQFYPDQPLNPQTAKTRLLCGASRIAARLENEIRF